MRLRVMKLGMLVIIACFIAMPLVAGGGAEEAPAETATSQAASGEGRFNEAPMLSEMVAAGEIPPVDERIPSEAMVRIYGDEIGEYGGTLYLNVTDSGEWVEVGPNSNITPYYLQMDYDGSIKPALMSDWELSEDYTQITFTLREGIHWSDGSPMTVDDFLFTWNDVQANELIPSWHWLAAPVTEAEQIDEWTFRLTFSQPNPSAVVGFAEGSGSQGLGYLPSEYLKPYHIDYNSDAGALAEEEGFESWNKAVEEHMGSDYVMERPSLAAWLREEEDSSLRVMLRNAFYPFVDEAGNQLPYIDRVVHSVVDGETYKLKIISGESDLAYFNTSFSDFTLLKENESQGDYRVIELPGLFGSEVMLEPNFNYKEAALRELLQNRDFRIALSVAINRDEINEVVLSGKGVPRQAAMPPNYQWYVPESATAYAQYDPEMANELLDELGLDARSSDGFRLRPDGEVLELVISKTDSYGSVNADPIYELITEYWQDVGVKTQVNHVDGGYYWELIGTEDFQIAYRAFEPSIESLVGNMEYVDFAPLWWQWVEANNFVQTGRASMSDYEDGLPGQEPPQWFKDHTQLYFEAKQYPPTSQEYGSRMEQIQRNHAENVFVIGTVGLVPNIVIAKNYIGNPPDRWLPNAGWAGSLIQFSDTIFIRQ